MKNNFFCKNVYTNIYEIPSHKSKISSQIIYGEKFRILSKNKNWIKIKTSFDNYIGFIKKTNFLNKFIPTHKIFRLKSRVFKKPLDKKKYETNNFLSFGSKLSMINENKKFIEYEKSKWIKKKDLKKN